MIKRLEVRERLKKFRNLRKCQIEFLRPSSKRLKTARTRTGIVTWRPRMEITKLRMEKEKFCPQLFQGLKWEDQHKMGATIAGGFLKSSALSEYLSEMLILMSCVTELGRLWFHQL